MIPPARFRRLRKVSRLRRQLVGASARLRNPIHKVLDAAGIRIAGVLSDVFGVNGAASWKGSPPAGRRKPSWPRCRPMSVPISGTCKMTDCTSGRRQAPPAHRPRAGVASTVPTSNKGFEEWGAILGDEVMAAALSGSAPPLPPREHPGKQLPAAPTGGPGAGTASGPGEKEPRPNDLVRTRRTPREAPSGSLQNPSGKPAPSPKVSNFQTPFLFAFRSPLTRGSPHRRVCSAWQTGIRPTANPVRRGSCVRPPNLPASVTQQLARGRRFKPSPRFFSVGDTRFRCALRSGAGLKTGVPLRPAPSGLRRLRATAFAQQLAGSRRSRAGAPPSLLGCSRDVDHPASVSVIAAAALSGRCADLEVGVPLNTVLGAGCAARFRGAARRGADRRSAFPCRCATLPVGSRRSRL